VPELIEDMCDYVNGHWGEATAIHLRAFVMWRLNWINPFADGNGRTARMTSYLVMSIKIGRVLAGTPTIPDQIVDNRQPYFDALDAADQACKEGGLDVSKMEDLSAYEHLPASRRSSRYRIAFQLKPGIALRCKRAEEPVSQIVRWGICHHSTITGPSRRAGWLSRISVPGSG
jgi:hypothetical protein